MKSKIFYLVAVIFAAYFANAQVLYTENFDNLTVGDLSTDPTGNTPGQGGWYTIAADSGNGFGQRL
jgi:hypothetical protein